MPPDPTPDKDAAAKLKALAEAALKAPKPGPTTSVLASAVLLLLDSQALQASEITALRTRMGMQATEIVERENEIAALRSRVAQLRGVLSISRNAINEHAEECGSCRKLLPKIDAVLSTPTGSDTAAPIKTEGGT